MAAGLAVLMRLAVVVLVLALFAMVMAVIMVVPLIQAVVVLVLVAAAHGRHAAIPVSAARSPFLITRAQALRNAGLRQVALVHSRFLPKVTQSLNSL
ncbi:MULTISPECIES: hypothetical protein [unclassified Paraburkholderia]|uniref:hypothetical protein n=1 Tax=unclassified Paraburkholderia TaxID=2615204 RepID=UPI002AB64E18|nr:MULTISPECIES: hypothetical protein [unclassified Paraburkholderia]